MNPIEISEHLRRVIARFAPLIDENLIAFGEAVDAIDKFLWTDPRCAEIPDAVLWRLSETAHADLATALDRPRVAAATAIRVSLGPLMHARKPRAELVIAAYRAANGRLSAQDVEHIVSEEIAAFMARVRTASQGFRHAG